MIYKSKPIFNFKCKSKNTIPIQIVSQENTMDAKGICSLFLFLTQFPNNIPPWKKGTDIFIFIFKARIEINRLFSKENRKCTKAS